MKCSICKQNSRDWTWQPELGSFYTPGNHIRGFMTVPCCDTCRDKIKLGETVSFVYKHQEYRANASALVSVEARDKAQIYPDIESAQAALDRGEWVQIAVKPFTLDPALIQEALDLQYKERFEEWKNREE